MKYIHIPTGTVVESVSELPPAIYRKAEEKPEPKKPARKPAAKKTTKE